ncbi:MAG TPA: alpha/beta hydrolase domain-containing protein [Blastocatellia bacterium]
MNRAKKQLALMLAGGLLILLAAADATRAAVTRIEIKTRADLLAGKEFALAGSYEKIVAKVYFEVDPANPRNRVIVDLDKAPRNARGNVEFSADLYILKPKDTARGNGAALVEIPNRGGKAMVRFFNHARNSLDPATEAEMGDGFLMRHGFTLVWIGWQFDTPRREGAMRLDAPVATDNGKVIEGWVRSDFVFNSKVFSASLGHRGQNAQPAINPDSRQYVLTVRDTVLGKRRVVPRDDWQFARMVEGKPLADPNFIYLKSGFEPGKIYEVVYKTQNPVVVGLGLAAVRDVVSYLKHEPGAIFNIKRAYGFGISQTGRFLRHFLYQGFNADERDRQVFDAVNPHVAGAGRGSFNHRFAEASRDASSFSTFFYPTDIFPFTDARQTDPETGMSDGLLTHVEGQPLPKIFYTFSSYEYWGRAASLIHTTVDGKADAPIPDNVRIYYFAGGQHGPGSLPPARPAAQGIAQTQQMASPVDYTWAMRALLLALDRWVREGASPPPSQYPRIADGTLVRVPEVKFPALAGVSIPRTIHEAYRVNYGADFKRGIIAKEPPEVGRAFTMMVPQVDSDGIDLAGIRMPEVAAPLATYTGWNLRDPEIGAPGEIIDFLGSYIPFAKTRAGRERARDGRPSIEERYASRGEYLGAVSEATIKLIKEGFLLAEDMPALVTRAGAHWDWAIKRE